MSSVSLIDGHIDEPRMTDNEIIKALESAVVCVGEEPFVEKERKGQQLKQKIFDLINRKNKTLKYQAEQIVDLKIKVKQQKAEIERLKAEVEKQRGL